MNRNYSRELEQIMQDPANKGKHLFLHSCCAPCSSYVLEYLRCFFHITVFYYNPNITEDEEYRRRAEEQKRLIQAFNCQVASEEAAREADAAAYPIEGVEGTWCRELFFEKVKGLEHCREGGERCFVCYEMRLEETAREAKKAGADYFTTTLTISPLKNAVKINEIGERLSSEYGIAFLPSDFKKKDGYRRSVELSKEYDLYRQDYCGCVFSKAERERRVLIGSVEQIHTTEMGAERIKRNLSLETDDVVAWCVERISDPHAVITRKGKNWYVEAEGCIFTINVCSYTIITAHKSLEKSTLK